jgi:hypothetical protein
LTLPRSIESGNLSHEAVIRLMPTMGDFLQLFWVRSNDRQSAAIRRPSNRFLAPAGLDAFAHALRLAVAAKSHSYILHIERETEHAAPSVPSQKFLVIPSGSQMHHDQRLKP